MNKYITRKLIVNEHNEIFDAQGMKYIEFPSNYLSIRNYCLRKRVRFIVEDEGEGFTNLDKWNEFYQRRQEALCAQDFDRFLSFASYRGPNSDKTDGGNSLIAALEFWNGGMIYNETRNKVGVVRWFYGIAR